MTIGWRDEKSRVSVSHFWLDSPGSDLEASWLELAENQGYRKSSLSWLLQGLSWEQASWLKEIWQKVTKGLKKGYR